MTSREANQQLTSDLKVVVHDAEELLKATTNEAGEKVKEIRTRLTATLESAKETCAHLQEKTAKAVKATDHVIREHPYETMGAAFGLGLLLGVLLARR